MRLDVLCIAEARPNSIAEMILISVRVTPSQAQQIDEYAERHGGLSRSASVRDLVSRQIKYERWVEGRRARNLPPYPTSRILKVEPPTPDRAVELAEIYRNRYPNIDDRGIAQLITGSATAYKSLRVKIADLVRRGNRERKNQDLERDMGADFQRQAENSGWNR